MTKISIHFQISILCFFGKKKTTKNNKKQQKQNENVRFMSIVILKPTILGITPTEHHDLLMVKLIYIVIKPIKIKQG